MYKVALTALNASKLVKRGQFPCTKNHRQLVSGVCVLGAAARHIYDNGSEVSRVAAVPTITTPHILPHQVGILDRDKLIQLVVDGGRER